MTERPSRSEAAANGWDDPVIRAKREARVSCCVKYGPVSMGYVSVPQAFQSLRLSEHNEPRKDATAKAVRLIIAQGGTVLFKGHLFYRMEN